MKHKIVLISGCQGSGKTTIANALDYAIRSRAKKSSVQLRFASAIYEMHSSILGVLQGYGIKTEKDKYGDLLQYLGTEFGRKNFGANVWVNTVKNKIAEQLELTVRESVFIVSDCRFRNEFDGFPDALRVRLYCDRETRKARCDSWRENDKHPSETDLDEYHDVLKFDLYLDTKELNPGHCVEMILAQLDKNSWMEKRK